MNPSTERQRAMLAHQISAAHDGSFNRTELNMDLLVEAKRMNEAGLLDKFDSSDLITCLQNYNEDFVKNPILIKSTNDFLRMIIKRQTGRF